MSLYEPSKADWKLFRERLPGWQERYMVRLCDEYATILTGGKRGSDAFWEIEKRIREDKKSPGVQVNLVSLRYGPDNTRPAQGQRDLYGRPGWIQR